MTEVPELKLLQNHQVVVDRFINACEFDDRIVAAFLGGSYARGTADEHFDLDLYLVIADNAFDNFISNRDAFLRLFGEPVFIENFDNPKTVCYIYADGTEGELWFGPTSSFTHTHSGPYIVLVDKKIF
jgi:predicted nucleotidyltransferase